MSIISLIIKREFKVRNKSFIVMTFKSAAVCVYCRICGYLSSMKAETNRDSR
jgi:hypothetical protein